MIFSSAPQTMKSQLWSSFDFLILGDKVDIAFISYPWIYALDISPQLPLTSKKILVV